MTDSNRTNILVLRLSALGDVAMTLPVIYSAAEANPAVTFTVVTRPFFSRLFMSPPANVKVIGVDPRDYKGALGALRLARRLAEERPTAVADLHNVLRTWLIDGYFRLHGVKVAMVDKKRSRRRGALASGRQQESFIERYRRVFASLGIDVPLTFRSLSGLGELPLPIEVKGPAVGIAPFARYANKTYPPEMMRRVVELIAGSGAKVYLFGGRGQEAEELQRWADAVEGCTSLAGRFPIEEELALMSRMRLMVSMDSANQHLASLVGCRVLTLWGSTTPACGFAAYGQSEGDSMVAGLDCQPCTVAGSPTCPLGTLDCFRKLTPEMVARRIMTMINE